MTSRNSANKMPSRRVIAGSSPVNKPLILSTPWPLKIGELKTNPFSLEDPSVNITQPLVVIRELTEQQFIDSHPSCSNLVLTGHYYEFTTD
jgi:hypothetical protein